MSRAEVLLAGALGLVVLAHLGLRADLSRRNVEFMPEMVTSPAFESQAPCPAFPDGKTMQAPPAGTIARGFLPLFSGDVPLDVTTPFKELPPAQVEAWNRLAPPPLDDAAAAAATERGAFVFANFCAACHGAGAAGDGASTKRGVPPPPALALPATREKSDGRLFRIVTCGEGNMAPYAGQVSREDRWNVIRYIRSLGSP